MDYLYIRFCPWLNSTIPSAGRITEARKTGNSDESTMDWPILAPSTLRRDGSQRGLKCVIGVSFQVHARDSTGQVETIYPGAPTISSLG